MSTSVAWKQSLQVNFCHRGPLKLKFIQHFSTTSHPDGVVWLPPLSIPEIAAQIPFSSSFHAFREERSNQRRGGRQNMKRREGREWCSGPYVDYGLNLDSHFLWTFALTLTWCRWQNRAPGIEWRNHLAVPFMFANDNKLHSCHQYRVTWHLVNLHLVTVSLQAPLGLWAGLQPPYSPG